VPIATVDLAWMLTAAIAAQDLGDATYVLSRSRSRLLSVQGLDGLFPHAVPAASQGRLRMHVGSFADQIYPIQALARASSATDDDLALDGANLCARQICDLQGEAGQWWWHYDARNGSVVEPYPVYSVHQHGMAPMALADLAAAGGEDQRAAAQLGLGWLDTHPETVDRLVDERFGVIWRKVGRREPRKAARKVRAVVSAVRPGLQTRFIDRLFPPGPIDHECRPYELGWLMYAWGTEHPRPHLRSLISTDDAEGADDAGLRSERDSA
jgi:hypothetical protein